MQYMPTINATDVHVFEKQCMSLFPYFSTVQIDISDGIFTPIKTLDIPTSSTLLKKVMQKLGKKVIYDFHIMVHQYENTVQEILNSQLDVRYFLVHCAVLKDSNYIQRKFPDKAFGIVINPEENIDTIRNKFPINIVPVIQIMSVHPGSQGQPFIADSMNKIDQLRTANYKNSIFMDGGLNNKTIPTILAHDYKPDVFCVGSYLTQTNLLHESFTFFEEHKITPA